MRLLYHYPLSPYSRKIRILLKEKDLPFELINENFWERRIEFMHLTPSGQVPVLVENEEAIIADSTAISEFLEEVHRDKLLIPGEPGQKAEVRSIMGWFDSKFYAEVTKHLLEEKVMKFLQKRGEPNSAAIRAGKKNIINHLDYIGWLLKKRTWLAGEEFTLADITAASQLSVLDYLGDVPWEHNEMVKNWYALVKSRPSFRPLLSDRIANFRPPAHYADLDF